MKIVITGGAGYIGSHTAVELLEKGNEVIIIDNLSNSSANVIDRIKQISGKTPTFYEADLKDYDLISQIFDEQKPEAVIHFAGLKAVGDSVANPLKYYRENIDSTLTLLEVMSKSGVKKLVFSSSATVYGSAPSPYNEGQVTGQGVTNPYGQTKYMIEQILRDTSQADPDWHIGSLRYFNPVGAHPTGKIGEQPAGRPNNLMPYITQVALGQRAELNIFGNDYDTPDGTGVRDYIHVCDLAEGHLRMLDALQPGFTAINLGSGHGTSVLELITTFERINGVKVPYAVAPRREGDLASYYANVDKANTELHWHTTRDLESIVRDSWRWQSANPNGYN